MGATLMPVKYGTVLALSRTPLYVAWYAYGVVLWYDPKARLVIQLDPAPTNA